MFIFGVGKRRGGYYPPENKRIPQNPRRARNERHEKKAPLGGSSRRSRVRGVYYINYNRFTPLRQRGRNRVATSPTGGGYITGSPLGRAGAVRRLRGVIINKSNRFTPLRIAACCVSPYPDKGRLTTCILTASATKPITQTKRANCVRPFSRG